MSNWKGIVGQSFTPDTLKDYVAGLNVEWGPKFVVLHNTAEPNLKDRPNGLTHDHILGLQSYYRDTEGWSSGPHFFCDDHQIWAFTPLTTTGTHAPGWNHESIGVEMLGEYTSEDFNSGRGLAVQQNAVACIAIVSQALGIDPDNMRLHKEDPQTTHKGCPGNTVNKANFIQAVKDYITNNLSGDSTT